MPPSNAAFPSFDALVKDHSRELYVYLWRVLQNEQDAEDCLQDTFLRAFRAYSSLAHAGNLRAWLYKIATNTARNHFRRNSRFQVESLGEAERLAGNEENPEALMEAQMNLHQMKEVIMSLPEKQRIALVLHRFQGLPYPETAAAMGISEDAARANVYQASRKLRSRSLAEEVQHA